MTNAHLPLLALAAALAAPASAQSAPADDADRLAAEMRVIGSNPTDVVALTQAGELSTRLGDLSGAASLFARADKVDPRNGRVKAGMADVLLHLERPGEALLFYNQAEGYGYPVARFAAERGLAYDLVAQQGRAQRDYRLALASGMGDDETVRRYALSLGISGQKEAALQQLEPLLRRNDRAGWRARAFVLAMNGETGAAQTIATTMMAPGQASGMAAFFARLPALGPADRAFAVQFGEVRPTPQRLADFRLAPQLPPLAPEIVAVARAAPPVQIAAAKADKHKRGRKGEVQLAAVARPPSAPALPSPPAYGVATRPVAVAALGSRALPPVSILPRAAVSGSGYAVPPTSVTRVLPARSPLPPPPVLARQVAPAPVARPVALAQATPSVSPVTRATPVAAPPVVLAQATPPRVDRLVPYERPGSMLPGYVRVPGALPASGSQTRVTGTLSAPAPVVAAVAPPRSSATTPVPVSVAQQEVPSAGAGGVPQTPSILTRLPSAAVTAPTTPVAFAAAAPLAVATPRTPVSAPPLAAGSTGPGTTIASAASPSVAAPPAPVSAVATLAPTAARPGLAPAPLNSPPVSAVTGVTPPPSAIIRPLGAGFGSEASTSTGAKAVASAVPGNVGGSPEPAPAIAAMSAPAIPREASPGALAPVTAGGSPVVAAQAGVSPSAFGPTPSATIQPIVGATTPVATAPTPATTAGFSPSSVGTAPVEPIASGEPAGVAVTSVAPVRDDGLARIVSALPVPASELNIAAPKRPAPVARQQIAAIASDVPSHVPGPVSRSRARDTDSNDEPRPTGGKRHQLASTDEDAPVGTRKHGAAATDDASARKTRGRKGAELADESAPRGRRTASTDDAPSTKGHHASLAKADEDDATPARGRHGRKTTSENDAPTTSKGRHAALAKADDDEAPPAHGKHGRHDTADADAKPSTGKHAAGDKHGAESQRYWVQVAGGANEASLGKAWSIAQGKAPALAGRKGYTTPLHATNRVLAGPFKTDDEARAFVNTLNKQGVHAFQFTNDKGQKVKRLDDE